jgi:hypothetical protein
MDPAVESYQTTNEWMFDIGKTSSSFGSNYGAYTNTITGAYGVCAECHEPAFVD